MRTLKVRVGDIGARQTVRGIEYFSAVSLLADDCVADRK